MYRLYNYLYLEYKKNQSNLSFYSYKEFLTPYELKIAQVLLTLDDTEQRRKYLNARNTISALQNKNIAIKGP